MGNPSQTDTKSGGGRNQQNTGSPHAGADRLGSASPSGADPAPKDKASGRDHPSESEHDHEHQKLHGESAKRIGRKPGD